MARRTKGQLVPGQVERDLPQFAERGKPEDCIAHGIDRVHDVADILSSYAVRHSVGDVVAEHYDWNVGQAERADAQRVNDGFRLG